jgi:hypothetical protein
MVAQLLYKGLNQCGLAQSRLACDEDNLADAPERQGEPGVEACQFCLSPYWRYSTAHCELRATKWRSSDGKIADEPIATSVYGLDKPWRPGIIPKGPP